MLLSNCQTAMGIPNRYKDFRIYDFYTDRYSEIQEKVDRIISGEDRGFIFLWGEGNLTALACSILTENFKQTRKLGYFSTLETLLEYKRNEFTEGYTPSYGSYNNFLDKFMVLDNIISPNLSNSAQMYKESVIGEFLKEKSYNDTTCIITSKYPLTGDRSVSQLLSERVRKIIEDSCVINFRLR